MTHSSRKVLIKFVIALATICAGIFFALQPTALVNAQNTPVATPTPARCDTNNDKVIDSRDRLCSDVCAILGNCPTALNNANQTNATTTIINIVNLVASTLIGLAAFISIFFIIYAGWMILSGAGKGSSEGIKQGQEILLNAFIGLAVSILAFIIVRFMVGFIDSVFS